MPDLAETIAEATAAYALAETAAWVPESRLADFKQLLIDLTIGALAADADARRGWCLEPSNN